MRKILNNTYARNINTPKQVDLIIKKKCTRVFREWIGLEGRRYGWTDGSIDDGSMDGSIDRWLTGQTDECRRNGWMKGWTDRRMDDDG